MMDFIQENWEELVNAVPRNKNMPLKDIEGVAFIVCTKLIDRIQKKDMDMVTATISTSGNTLSKKCFELYTGKKVKGSRKEIKALVVKQLLDQTLEQYEADENLRQQQKELILENLKKEEEIKCIETLKQGDEALKVQKLIHEIAYTFTPTKRERLLKYYSTLVRYTYDIKGDSYSGSRADFVYDCVTSKHFSYITNTQVVFDDDHAFSFNKTDREMGRLICEKLGIPREEVK